MKKASVWILAAVAIGVMLLALIALKDGPAELTALATVLAAGAGLVASISRK
jgi:hypothetical protein